MSETAMPVLRPMPQPRHVVRSEDRDFNAPKPVRRIDGAAAMIAALLTRREREIMRALLQAIQPDGGSYGVNRADLRTSATKMQEMYWEGYVNGAGSRDERGTGNTPATSWWWLTAYGEEIAREIKE